MRRLIPGFTRLKQYSFLTSMPFIIAMLQLIMFEDRVWQEPSVWIFSSLIIFVMGFFSMVGHVQYDNWVEKKYPLLSQTRQRILTKSLITVFVMTPSVYAIFLLYHVFHLFNYSIQPDHLWQGALVGLSVNVIFETLYEADFVFRRVRENTAENATLQQLSLRQEFDTLKNQVNPHFLFNCFNTLSSLIGTDKQKAVQFLDELSKVYRSLLRSNQDSLSVLSQELEFIESYYGLLKTRYGGAVKMRINIDRQYLSYLIPSLSLQLLVENAVKHNTVSKKYPLTIEIFTSGENKLVVNNNLQRKVSLSHSNGMGLQNIKAKYELLQCPGFQVMDGERNFTVVLPLIWRPAESTQNV